MIEPARRGASWELATLLSMVQAGVAEMGVREYRAGGQSAMLLTAYGFVAGVKA